MLAPSDHPLGSAEGDLERPGTARRAPPAAACAGVQPPSEEQVDVAADDGGIQVDRRKGSALVRLDAGFLARLLPGGLLGRLSFLVHAHRDQRGPVLLDCASDRNGCDEERDGRPTTAMCWSPGSRLRSARLTTDDELLGRGASNGRLAALLRRRGGAACPRSSPAPLGEQPAGGAGASSLRRAERRIHRRSSGPTRSIRSDIRSPRPVRYPSGEGRS